MIFKPFVKAIKWLIFTNIYIALAAVCFQGVYYYFNLEYTWHWPLSVNTFFSTWLVYQFSRWNFHKNYDLNSNKVSTDELYQFVDRNLNFTIISVGFSFIATLVSCFFLRLETLFFIGFLGVISVVYPLKIGTISLRSIPFVKIFLIAIVWSGTAVWVPFIEIQHNVYWHEQLSHFAFFFLFILFITLPFDMNDIRIDKITGVKTIPSVLGIQKTNRIIIVLGILLSILAVIIFQDRIFAILTIILISTLGVHAVKYAESIEKWKVMAIYDGSMILLYLLTVILHVLLM